MQNSTLNVRFVTPDRQVVVTYCLTEEAFNQAVLLAKKSHLHLNSGRWADRGEIRIRISQPFPAALICARLAAGLRRTELAKVLGVHLRTVQYWEEGGRLPSRLTQVGALRLLKTHDTTPALATRPYGQLVPR
jgi:DNA-binding transcriptional regulator YiaG